MAIIWRARGRATHLAANFGHSPSMSRQCKRLPARRSGRGSYRGRVLLEGASRPYSRRAGRSRLPMQRVRRSRADIAAMLGVPLLREGSPIGVLVVTRPTVRPFTDKQIELVTTFADQAVIAIENVRLFDEVQARTRELGESLEQQTATADILRSSATRSATLSRCSTPCAERAQAVLRTLRSWSRWRTGTKSRPQPSPTLNPARVEAVRRRFPFRSPANTCTASPLSTPGWWTFPTPSMGRPSWRAAAAISWRLATARSPSCRCCAAMPRSAPSASCGSRQGRCRTSSSRC